MPAQNSYTQQEVFNAYKHSLGEYYDGGASALPLLIILMEALKLRNDYIFPVINGVKIRGNKNFVLNGDSAVASYVICNDSSFLNNIKDIKAVLSADEVELSAIFADDSVDNRFIIFKRAKPRLKSLVSNLEGIGSIEIEFMRI